MKTTFQDNELGRERLTITRNYLRIRQKNKKIIIKFSFMKISSQTFIHGPIVSQVAQSQGAEKFSARLIKNPYFNDEKSEY